MAKVDQPTITATEHRYIVKNDRILSGEPIIKGTRTPVRAIVETWRMGVLPEEINRHIERNRIPEELLDPLVRDL